jgi:DNA-binding SARP family transcriptional activator
MREPFHGPEALDDDAANQQAPTDRIPDADSLSTVQSLLEQSVDRLQSLRQEYQRMRALLENLRQHLSLCDTQLVLQAAQVDHRLDQAVALMAGTCPPDAGNLDREHDTTGQTVLRVQSLGTFAIYRGERVIALSGSRKGRALLRYLITRPERRAARDVLLDLFWPGESADKATHKLHIAVSTLRQSLREAMEQEGSHPDDLPQDWIVFEEGHYRLGADIRVHLDTDSFAAHYQAGERLDREGHISDAITEYEAARALYHGDFLTEDLYADWAIAPRARLEEIYLTLLGRLADRYLTLGRHRECVACCRQILARDSFREDAYRTLMRCYSRMGQRNRALREYASCEQVLQRELGVHPMRETAELYERLVREERI